MVERARPAVVHVRGTVGEDAAPAGGPQPGTTPGRRSGLSIGTGFFIEKDGLVVTNEHVVRNVTALRVRLYDGLELPACVVGWDAATDIALLRAEVPRPVPVLPLGNSDAVKVGEPAIVIGNPFGFNHSVTAGIISAKERVIDREMLRREAGPGEDTDTYSFFLQTDASINLGNSGGPLLDVGGNVIGVSAAFWGSSQPAQGIGFAIPIDIVKLLLPRLRREGSAPRSFVGVESQPIDPSLAAALNLPSTRGALIASVESGSPAALGGLEAGDVIERWGAHAVVSLEDFKIYAQLTAPATTVSVGLLREGKREERTLSTRAAPALPRPVHPAGCSATPRRSGSAGPLGLEVASWPVASAASGAAAVQGVVVRRVAAGPGREAGLLPADVITRVGRRPVRSPAELERAIALIEGERPVALLVWREGYYVWLTLSRR